MTTPTPEQQETALQAAFDRQDEHGFMLTVEQVANMTQRRVPAIRWYIRTGRLPAILDPNFPVPKYLINPTDVGAVFANRKPRPGATGRPKTVTA